MPFLACLVAIGTLAPDTSCEPVLRGAVSLGAFDVSGSVMQLKLDDTGRRLLIAEVRALAGCHRPPRARC